MLDSIKEISNHPVVILLYKSGASGEFLSYALTESIDQFTKTTMSWKNTNQCIVQDYFGRSLLVGAITEDVVLPRINLYFEMAQHIGTWHMGISHLQPHQIEFVKNYGATWPVIEIITMRPVSEQFRQLARNSKIHKNYQPTSYNKNNKINSTTTDMGHKLNKHLQIEWSDLLLTDTCATYSKILQFLDCTGNVGQFSAMVDDYVGRNQDLIKIAYEN
jgi:hypothetical protein